MTNKKGTNQFKTRYRYPLGISYMAYINVLELIVFLLVIGIVAKLLQPKVISPLSDNPVFASEPTPTPTPKPLTVDEMVHKYCFLYESTTYRKNRCKALVHYLLLREQNYGGSTKCGDSGKACGPLQYHEPTFIGYSKLMVKKGLISKIGSRFNMEDSIQVTAWAISDNREKAWGPVFRSEIKI